MKRKIAYLITIVAMIATGAASLGCSWWLFDEPKAFKSLYY